jgi:hypothetical protein
VEEVAMDWWKIMQMNMEAMSGMCCKGCCMSGRVKTNNEISPVWIGLGPAERL